MARGDNLSERSRGILRYIHRYNAKYGQAPSRREIATACAIPSISTVTYHLKKLERLGLIRVRRGVARGIRLVDG